MSMICSGFLSSLKSIQRIGYIFLLCGRGRLIRENTGWWIYKLRWFALFLWREVYEEKVSSLPDFLDFVSILPSNHLQVLFFHDLDRTDQDAMYLPIPYQQVAC